MIGLFRALWMLLLWLGLLALVEPLQAQAVPLQTIPSGTEPYARLSLSARHLTTGRHHPTSTLAVCDDFPPPPGERWTYQLVGTTLTFSTFTEEVNALIGGRVVYRIGGTDSPPGLGLYIGCDDTLGEVDVATDSWNAFEPNNPQFYDRDFWEPPLFHCQYGDPVGTRCEWTGTFGAEQEREVMEILAYESIAVPLGAFAAVMKARITTFDSNDEVIPEPIFVWFDASVGLLRAEGVDTGDVLELTAYTSVPTGTARDTPGEPEASVLRANYPNPFNPSTTISFALSASNSVSLRVFDVLGREVATLVDAALGPGTYRVAFEAAGLPSGVYFYRMEAGAFREVRQMLLLR